MLERAFVCAVDMPFLTIDVIDELARNIVGVDVVLPWDGRDHYLAGIYRTDLADRIDALVAAGERSMRALAETVVTQRVVLPADPRAGQRQFSRGSAEQIVALRLHRIPPNLLGVGTSKLRNLSIDICGPRRFRPEDA